MRLQSFEAEAERFCGHTVLHPVPPENALEIDSFDDFERAELLLRHRHMQRSQGRLPERPRALVLDFDGALTDNSVMVGDDGREAVRCDRGDGLGMERLRRQGLELWILSKERNPVVSARAKKLGVPCLQAIDDKKTALSAWAAEQGIDLGDVVYIGNDVNDVECMQMVGCAVCPADAYSEAMQSADIVLDRPGGRGAVRELCDLLLAQLAGSGAGG